MNQATWDLIKPMAAQAARDFLRTVGMFLAARGFIQGDAGVATFMGAGMALAGLFWGWFTTKGYLQAGALLKKLTASHTTAVAVEVAKVMPSAEQTGAADKAKAIVTASGVVKVLLVAFALSAFLAGGPAYAQVKLHAPTGNLANDLGITTAKPPMITGNAEKDLQALWDKIVASSIDDLNYAAAMAKNANTQTSGIRLQCINAIITLNQQASGANLKNPDGTPMTKPDPHVFTDVESLAEVIDNLSPQGPLFVNCAGAAQLAKTNVLTFVNAVITGAAGFAAMPVIPGL